MMPSLPLVGAQRLQETPGRAAVKGPVVRLHRVGQAAHAQDPARQTPRLVHVQPHAERRVARDGLAHHRAAPVQLAFAADPLGPGKTVLIERVLTELLRPVGPPGAGSAILAEIGPNLPFLACHAEWDPIASLYPGWVEMAVALTGRNAWFPSGRNA